MKYLIDKEKLEARIDELLAGDGSRQADNVEGIALCALRKCLVPYEEKKEVGYNYYCKHNILKKDYCINCQKEAIANEQDDRCTEKKEECRIQWEKNGSTYICIKEKPCPDHDNRCTKCNGDGKLMNQWDKATCVHCNGTGKEPRKEQESAICSQCMKKCGASILVRSCEEAISEIRKIDKEKLSIAVEALEDADECLASIDQTPTITATREVIRTALAETDTRTHALEMKTYTQDEVRKMLEELKMRDNLAGNSKEVQEDRKHMNTKIDKKIAEL